MHIQPVDNATDMEPFVIGMNPEPRQDGTDQGETFDDVWGSAPSSPSLPARDTAPSRDAHPSDMRRLQAEHTTAGYREGVTAAKNESIQAGFDEGFGLGAAIGSQAGQLLGVLEGIASAVAGSADDALRDSAAKTLRDAREELSIERMFGPEHWNADGTWRFDVAEEDGETVFAHVAAAHPVIVKWTGIVDGQVARWGIDRGVFADVADEERQQHHEKTAAASSATQQTRKPLDW